MTQGSDFDESARTDILDLVRQANKKLLTPKLFSAIFVDEAQDLTMDELEALLQLSDNVCICGDARQGIYNRWGLEVAGKLGLSMHTLQGHFRIGQRVAHVADGLMPPMAGCDSLESTSNYNPKEQGESSANTYVCADRDEQFQKMIDLIGVQPQPTEVGPNAPRCRMVNGGHQSQRGQVHGRGGRLRSREMLT